MEKLIYLGVIMLLLVVIMELYRWMILYKKMHKSISDQNYDFVKVHRKLSDDFVIQFKKYETESVNNRKMIDDYTKMYHGYLDLYNSKK